MEIITSWNCTTVNYVGFKLIKDKSVFVSNNINKIESNFLRTDKKKLLDKVSHKIIH